MNKLFDLCVYILRELSSMLNMTYQEINIWLFVIIMPLIIIVSIGMNFYLYQRIRTYNIKKKLLLHLINSVSKYFEQSKIDSL